MIINIISGKPMELIIEKGSKEGTFSKAVFVGDAMKKSNVIGVLVLVSVRLACNGVLLNGVLLKVFFYCSLVNCCYFFPSLDDSSLCSCLNFYLSKNLDMPL